MGGRPGGDLAASRARLQAEVEGEFAALTTRLDQAIRAMTLEHYPGMTEKALEAIVDEARARVEVRGVQVLPRGGVPGPAAPPRPAPVP